MNLGFSLNNFQSYLFPVLGNITGYVRVTKLLDSSIKMEFLVSDGSSYFSHYSSKIQHATDVDFKSYTCENVAKVQKLL